MPVLWTKTSPVVVTEAIVIFIPVKNNNHVHHEDLVRGLRKERATTETEQEMVMTTRPYRTILGMLDCRYPRYRCEGYKARDHPRPKVRGRSRALKRASCCLHSQGHPPHRGTAPLSREHWSRLFASAYQTATRNLTRDNSSWSRNIPRNLP